MQFETFLNKAGESGPFQLMLFCLIGIVNMYTGMENMAINFLAPSSHPHWCRVPELSSLPEHLQHSIAIPWNAEQEQYETCLRYDIPSDNLTAIADMYHEDDDMAAILDRVGLDNSSVRTCDEGWDFDQSQFHNTIISEWSLVCDSSTLLEMISPVYTCGLLVGSLMGGIVSDSLGRMMSLLIFSLLHLLAGVGTAFAPNVWVFIITRFLIAVSIRGAGISGAVLLMETLSARYRVAAVVGYQMCLALGIIVVSALALLLRDFRQLQLAIVVPLVVMVSYKWLLPDSPRWLMSKNRIDGVVAAVKKIARMNGREISEAECKYFTKANDLTSDTASQISAVELKRQAAEKMSFIDLFRNPVLRRYTITSYILMSVCLFIDLGVALNVSTLFGDVYTNTFLTGSTEMAANFLIYFGLHYIGRRPPLVACFVGIIASEGMSVGMEVMGHHLGSSILSILSRCFASSGYLTLGIYVAEIFPTPVRQAALGSANAIGAAMCIAAPIVGGNLHLIWFPLPNIIYGSLSLLCIPLCFLLPETRGLGMPETLADTLNIAKPKVAKDDEESPSEKPAMTTGKGGENDRPVVCDVLFDPGQFGPFPGVGPYPFGFNPAVQIGRHTDPMECGVYDARGRLLYTRSASFQDYAFTNVVCLRDETQRPTGNYMAPRVIPESFDTRL